ncbi:hypothetical protein ASF32_20890 [Methylobacterium sp. Leaf91]|nr:hypothetical protein ASF24_18150 [Methylobacterium sp. Leaf86]KQO93613.1 hypothetical protein ASF32_20890 [Methylobacterium sp. Leaf91]
MIGSFAAIDFSSFAEGKAHVERIVSVSATENVKTTARKRVISAASVQSIVAFTPFKSVVACAA